MARYFNIDYEFDRDEVHRRIARRIGDRSRAMSAWPTA